MEIVPFETSHVDDAARILAGRHRRDRASRPELPERFEQIENARGVLTALLDKGDTMGVAAFRNARMVGYLVGSAKHSADRERHIWVDYAGSAVTDGESAELYRDLYAAGGAEWVTQGYHKHYVVVPSEDPAVVDAWFRSGFGHEQVHGILGLPADIDSADPLPTDFEIRLAQKSDEEIVRSIATMIWEYHTKAPIWAIALPEEAAKLGDGYAELLSDASVQFWLALHDDEILGYQVFWPDEGTHKDMATPDASVSLGVGGTLPQARGKGVGTALVRHGLAHAASEGFSYCTTDWRMTNLLSSRFWPERGFRPVAYRLFRQVDHRIAWARLDR